MESVQLDAARGLRLDSMYEHLVRANAKIRGVVELLTFFHTSDSAGFILAPASPRLGIVKDLPSRLSSNVLTQKLSHSIQFPK
jgi:hypothetical protein